MTDTIHWKPDQKVIVTTMPMGKDGEIQEVDVTPLLLLVHGCGMNHDLWEEHDYMPTVYETEKLCRALSSLGMPLSDSFLWIRDKHDFEKFRLSWNRHKKVSKTAKKMGVSDATIRRWLEVYGRGVDGDIHVMRWGDY